MAERRVGRAESGGSIELTAGDELVIELPENPTTGFRWSELAPPGDILELIADDFVNPRAGAPGGGGMRVFRLRATGAGETTLECANRQEWRPEPAAQQFVLRVTVR